MLPNWEVPQVLTYALFQAKSCTNGSFSLTMLLQSIMFISLQRHWKIQNMFKKHTKVKVFVLILVGSGCCYEWIGYPQVPKIKVSDRVLEATTPVLSMWDPFFPFSYTPFLSLSGILEDGWETKSVLSWALRVDFCKKGMPSFSTQKRQLQKTEIPGWIFRHDELLQCELFCLPFSLHAMLRFVCTAAS